MDRPVQSALLVLPEPVGVRVQLDQLDSLVSRVTPDLLVVLELPAPEDRLVLPATLDRLDRQVHPDLLDRVVLRVPRVWVDLPDREVRLVFQAPSVRPAHQVQLELPVWLGQLELRDSEDSLVELVPLEIPVRRDEQAT